MENTVMQWPAPGKINLFLYINKKRNDGYHQLQTLYQFLDYGDSLGIYLRNDGQIRLLNSIPQVSNNKNLAVLAAKILQKATNCSYGADIEIKKRLPVGSGLGGGSSNAATTLAVLNHLWNCKLSIKSLQQLGCKLGADVPIFLYGHCAIGQGIGEQLYPTCLTEKWYLIAYPNINICTAAIFNDPGLIRNTPKRPIFELLNSPYTNDCEQLVKEKFPKIKKLILWLSQYAPARMTGTGSAVFAEFTHKNAAREILDTAPKDVHCFIARGINYSPLQQALK